MTERLDVYLCDRLAGALERTDGRISFRAGIGGKLVLDSISRQIAAVKNEIPSLVDEVDKRHPSPVYHEICRGIRARIRQLAS